VTARIRVRSVLAGTPQHLYGELFKMMTGVDMLHVPNGGIAALKRDFRNFSGSGYRQPGR
jgi:hypothetical protein